MLLIDLCLQRIWRKSSTKGARVTVKDRFTKYFPAIGITIPKSMLNNISRIITKRNKIIHGDQTKNATRKYALKTIDDALVFIDFVMNQLLEL